jgi:hypothetical protein
MQAYLTMEQVEKNLLPFSKETKLFCFYYLFNPFGLLTMLDFLESNKWAGMNARSQINTLSLQ